MTYKEKSTLSQSGSWKAVYVLPQDQPSSRSKENQLLTSMRGELLIACHALMDILVKGIVVLGTHDGGAKGKTNVSGGVEPM
jgi:hypothetical protein